MVGEGLLEITMLRLRRHGHRRQGYLHAHGMVLLPNVLSVHLRTLPADCIALAGITDPLVLLYLRPLVQILLGLA